MDNRPTRIRRTVQALVTDGEVGLNSARSTVAILAALVQAGLTKADIQMLELIVEDVAGREPHKAWDDYLTDLFNDGNQSFTWRLGAGTAGGAAMATDAFAGPTHLPNELVVVAGIASALALLGGGGCDSSAATKAARHSGAKDSRTPVLAQPGSRRTARSSMSIPSNGFHVDAEGLIVLGLTLVVAVVALPSILLSTIDSWQRFRRERDFQRLLQATLTDPKRTSSSAEGGLGVREEFVNEPALNSTVVRTLLGDDQFPYTPRPIKVEP